MLILVKKRADNWTPEQEPTVLDFGIYTDLSRIKQDSAGNTAATVGDPVGWWRGQLDVVTMTQANGPEKPAYAADGVNMNGLGTSRFLTASRTIGGTAPFWVAMCQKLATGNNSIEFGRSYNGSVWWGPRSSEDAVCNAAARITTTYLGSLAGISQKWRVITTFDGGSDARGYLNGAATAMDLGGFVFDTNGITLRGSVNNSDNYARAWAVGTGVLDASTAAKVDKWLKRQ